MENLFAQWDDILACQETVLHYADGLCAALHDAERNAVQQVITTQGYDLGIACPSLVRHIVIGGHKKGKIVKDIPQGKNYQIISYDAEDKPIAFRSVNSFGVQNAYFFFPFQGFIWAADMNANGTLPYSRLYRMQYDAQGRILSFYIIERTFLSGEEYTYTEGKPTECLCYDYVPHKCKTAKNIPAGYAGSPIRLSRYVIHADTIDGYEKMGEKFVFVKTFRMRNAKSTTPPEMQFIRQLDSLLQNAALPKHCGVYFELHEGNEAMYRIDVSLTPTFDAEDEEWACTVETVLGELMITKLPDMEWKDIQDTAAKLIRFYLKEGQYRTKLLSCGGIGTGFGDGDLILLP